MQGERRQSRTVERRAGIQRVVADRVEQAAVIIVGAALGNDVDLRAARGARLRRVVGGADAELVDRVQRDVEAGIGLLGLFLHAGGVDAVEGEVVVVERMSGEADVALRAVSIVDRARRQNHQAGPVAAADRDLLDLRRFNHAAHLRVGAIQHLGRRRDFHRLRSAPDLQARVDGPGLPVPHDDLVHRRGLEAGLGDGDRVGSHGEGVDFIETSLAGHGGAVQSGRFGFQFHRGRRHQRSRGIRHGAADGRPILRAYKGGRTETKEENS